MLLRTLVLFSLVTPLYCQIFGPVTGGINRKIDVFTSSGTWIKPSSVDHVSVIIVGAGGGGPRSTDGTIRGYGGGGGCVYLIDYPVTGNVTVTVGTGGSGGASSGNPGSDGGASCFGLFCALGGRGGVIDVGGPGGGMSVGGSIIYSDTPVNQPAAFVGNLIYRFFGGGAGGTLTINPSAGCTGAGGGGVSYGKPYAPGMAASASNGGIGSGGAGQFPGGGGAGSTTGGGPGGAGANGVVVVLY